MLGDVRADLPVPACLLLHGSFLLSLSCCDFKANAMFPGVSRFSLLLLIAERKNGVSGTFQGMDRVWTVSDLRKKGS